MTQMMTNLANKKVTKESVTPCSKNRKYKSVSFVEPLTHGLPSPSVSPEAVTIHNANQLPVAPVEPLTNDLLSLTLQSTDVDLPWATVDETDLNDPTIPEIHKFGRAC